MHKQIVLQTGDPLSISCKTERVARSIILQSAGCVSRNEIYKAGYAQPWDKIQLYYHTRFAGDGYVPKLLARLMRLVEAGETLTTAASRCGVSRSTAHRWIVRYGQDVHRRTKPRIPEETRERIRVLRQQGLSVSATAAICHVDRRSVRRWCIITSAVCRCPHCGALIAVAPCIACEVRSRNPFSH